MDGTSGTVHFAPIMLPCTNVLACILINGIDLYLIEAVQSDVRCFVLSFSILLCSSFRCGGAVEPYTVTVIPFQ